ncbi:MAG TPA: hypothetical protein PLN69_11355 [bacterium]|nr:hypothetical protein [bacterium]
MDSLSCLDIQKKVLEILENDPVLSGYVKEFSIGGENTARKLFPCVTVAEVTNDIEPLCIGPGAPNLNRYRIVIRGGTRHTLPEIARRGDGAGKKGIVQLTDDIVAAIYPGNLEGIFKRTLHLEEACPMEIEGSGGKSWITRVILTGNRKA